MAFWIACRSLARLSPTAPKSLTLTKSPSLEFSGRSAVANGPARTHGALIALPEEPVCALEQDSLGFVARAPLGTCAQVRTAQRTAKSRARRRIVSTSFELSDCVT